MPTCCTRGPVRSRSWRRLATGSLCIAAASAALALAGPYALEPFADAAGAATEVGVAFVLDFGGDRGQVVGCVHVPSSDDRYDALAAFTQQEHLEQPTYNDTGLLCSIGGIPVSGCGQQVGNRYIYWSYFTGPTTTDGPGPWTYSSTGAFAPVGACTPGPGGALVGCDVEGWRFQDPGTGLPNDPAPRKPADYAAICLSSVTTTTTDPTTSSSTPTAPTSPAGGPTTTLAPSGHGTPNGSVATTTLPSGSVVTTTAPTTATGPGGAPAIGTAHQAGAHTSTTTSAPRYLAGGHAETVGSTPASAHPSGGSGSTPLVVGGVLVVLLVAASVLRWRKRPRMP